MRQLNTQTEFDVWAAAIRRGATFQQADALVDQMFPVVRGPEEPEPVTRYPQFCGRVTRATGVIETDDSRDSIAGEQVTRVQPTMTQIPYLQAVGRVEREWRDATPEDVGREDLEVRVYDSLESRWAPVTGYIKYHDGTEVPWELSDQGPNGWFWFALAQVREKPWRPVTEADVGKTFREVRFRDREDSEWVVRYDKVIERKGALFHGHTWEIVEVRD